MPRTLPKPEVLCCYFDSHSRPHLPAMSLRWDMESLASSDQVWELPGGLQLSGPPPVRFGLNITRSGDDCYEVRLLWNQTGLTWRQLSRRELLGSSLAPLLEAMGTDLWYLLDQPIQVEEEDFSTAA